MNEWENFNETPLPEKEEFYRKLDVEHIIDTDQIHAEKVCKDFEMKILGKYHDLYLTFG